MDAHAVLNEALDLASDNGARSWLRKPVLTRTEDNDEIVGDARLQFSTRLFVVATADGDGSFILDVWNGTVFEDQVTMSTSIAELWMPQIVASYLR